jgi:transposase
MSVIGAITHTGRVLFQTHDKGIKSKQVAKFVRFILNKIPGKILLIWDRARIHMGEARLLLEAERDRVKVEQLPAYAPELNPQEGVWHLLKDVELKNVCCDSPAELHRQFRLATVRLRHRKKALLACFTHAGCRL